MNKCALCKIRLSAFFYPTGFPLQLVRYGLALRGKYGSAYSSLAAFRALLPPYMGLLASLRSFCCSVPEVDQGRRTADS
jgi:hypothetical protein